MTLKIGDRVRFLNDVGGGVITAYIDEKMVEVQTDDGFELPVLATELLLDVASGFGFGGEGTTHTQPSATKVEEELEMPKLKTEDYRFEAFKGEAILAIVPENDTLLHVSDLKLYLINDSNYSIQYMVSESDGGVAELVDVGLLEPDTKLQLKRYAQTTLSKLKKFTLQAHFYKQGLMEHIPAVKKDVDIDGMSFYKGATFSENDYFDSKAVVFIPEEIDMKKAVEQLSKNDLLKIKSEKGSLKKTAKLQESAKPDIEEVDLHIGAIIDNPDGMSNGEIVEVQLARFETSLETAMRSETKKIVFIHGVGNGRLKHELTKKLDRKYTGLKYQDASFKEYGYGATMVYLK